MLLAFCISEEAILLCLHLTVGGVFFFQFITNDFISNVFTQDKLVLRPRVAACTLQGGVRQPDLLLLGDLTTIKSDEDIQVLCLSRYRAFSSKKLREGCKARSF